MDERRLSEQAGRPWSFDGQGALLRLAELYRRFQLPFEILINDKLCAAHAADCRSGLHALA